MKKILLSAMALLPLFAMAQKPFTINGSVKGLKTGAKVYLIYAGNEKNITDSAVVTNGAFAFKGNIAEPAQGSLFLNKNPYVNRPAQGEKLDGLSIYVEPATIKLTGTDSLKTAVISGSTVNADSKTLKELTKDINAKLAALNVEYSKFTPAQKQDKALIEELSNRADKISAGITPILLDFVKNNPKSFISLNAVNQVSQDEEHLNDAKIAFEKLSPEIKASKAGKQLVTYFESVKNTAVGAMAMDFTQNTPEGKPVKLSDFKGKYVLLDFWASWCGPCRQENPNVVIAYNKFKDKNFTVLGVSLDRPGQKEAWTKAISADNLTWTHVSDLMFWNSPVVKQYGIKGIPANFLIDPSGKIIGKNLRGEDLDKKLEEVLASKSK